MNLVLIFKFLYWQASLERTVLVNFADAVLLWWLFWFLSDVQVIGVNEMLQYMRRSIFICNFLNVLVLYYQKQCFYFLFLFFMFISFPVNPKSFYWFIYFDWFRFRIVFINLSKIYKFLNFFRLVFKNPEVFFQIWIFVFLTKKIYSDLLWNQIY